MLFNFKAEVRRTSDEEIELVVEAEDEAEAEESAVYCINGHGQGRSVLKYLVKTRFVRPADDIKLEMTGFHEDTPGPRYA